MAYMNQEKKAALAPQIKAVLKKYKMKGSIKVRNYSTLVVTVKSGPLDISSERGLSIMYAHSKTVKEWGGEREAFIRELLNAMNEGNHDNSDIMTDYFDVGHYSQIDTFGYQVA